MGNEMGGGEGREGEEGRRGRKEGGKMGSEKREENVKEGEE